VPLEVREALVCAVCLLLYARDVRKVAALFDSLMLMPTSALDTPAKRQEFEAALQAAADRVLVYPAGGFAPDTLPSLRFDQLLGELAFLAARFEFQLPPYFLNNARGLATLEGMALSADPSFDLVRVVYPFALRRLLADPTSSPLVRDTLWTLVTDDSGAVRPSKLRALLRDTALLSGVSRRRIVADFATSAGGRALAADVAKAWVWRPTARRRAPAPRASASSSPNLDLLTFDLDDTFWPTGAVVDAANAVLCDALGVGPAELQGTMKEVRREHDARDGTPLTYTDVRTRAIYRTIGGGEQRGVLLCPKSRKRAEQLFDLWLDERHAAAERLLYDGAVEALRECRARWPDATVGAITNGRGDPAAMPSLAPYFGWCVTGERADIHPHRKPAPQIFEAALARAGRDSAHTGWVHVGDCLLNDVAASKGVGARTVWLDAAVEGDEDAHGAYSTMSDAQRAARQAQFDAVGSEVVDVRIESIRELAGAVERAIQK
jgi:FMN phosphatase YigB (HAD superfamily)